MTGSQKVTTGPFIQIQRIEKELQKGVSTQSDVRSLLGEPNGFGNSIMPPAYKQNNVWFYENIEVANMRSVGGGYYEANYHQQILLVFFKEEVYDGFSTLVQQGSGAGEHL